MPDETRTPTGGIGARIQQFRTIRGFSLTELGRRAHASPSQLSRIENGSRSISPAMEASVARALGVTVSVLHGQPYIHMLQQDQLDALLTPISSALDAWDIPPDDGPPRSLEDIAADVRTTVSLRLQTRFAEIAQGLPSLIVEAAAAALTAPVGARREQAHRLQAELARTAAIMAYRLGFLDLARLALSRMAMAAPHSGDPVQVAIERFERSAMTHAQSARSDRGVALMRVALRDLDDDGRTGTRAVRGALYLRAASLALQQEDASGAENWLGQAAELAEQIGDVYHHALMFGPFGVALAQMGAENDRDDHGAALARASEMRLPDHCPPTLKAHFLIRRARAEVWTAHHDEALRSLRKARKVAPQLTRYHPHVHETVGTLLRARAKAGEQLREYAQWSGV
ncbi:helix-turn-helix domain-containing protein [Streptomyces litchfieldiae]|uniref:Helix-turn-helix transcriptional regulator n=1 Tax=Streptomyces litchfieldiae TaxID=3075543 RepID=A0ABU2MLH4_9ACTN|nr:helix-turn-helix transcriptional regulator [Streptomyces sp. DSM 44938]MDT0342456.1 helix-turn-helix transcriptional regulator [Streptomyces sp. DSM 44938]